MLNDFVLFVGLNLIVLWVLSFTPWTLIAAAIAIANLVDPTHPLTRNIIASIMAVACAMDYLRISIMGTVALAQYSYSGAVNCTVGAFDTAVGAFNTTLSTTTGVFNYFSISIMSMATMVKFIFDAIDVFRPRRAMIL